MIDYKEGDWVIDKNRRWPPFQLIQADHLKGEQLVETGSYIDVDCELWKPKYKDYCWFWNDDQLLYNGTPHFGRYGIGSYTEDFYEHIEPFVNDIPSYCKRVKE